MPEKLTLELNKPAEDELLYAKAQTGTSKFGDWSRYSLKSGQSLFVSGNDCQDPDEMFRAAGVAVGVPFRICLRKTKAAGRYYEVQRLSDAAAPAPAQPQRAIPHRNQAVTPAARLQEKLEESVRFADLDDVEPALDATRFPDQEGRFAPPATAEESQIERELAWSIRQLQQRKTATPTRAPSPAATTRQPASQVTAPPLPNPIAVMPAQQGTRASNVMAGALCAAVDAAIIATQYAAAKGFPITFGAEDLRAIAATLYIAASKEPGFLSAPGASGGASWRQ